MQRRILIVDDDPIVLKGMRRVLERADWVVQTVYRADEALACLERGPDPDAVIADYDLGDHDGLAVLEWMRDNRPSRPRILMTGHDDLPLVVAAVNRGEAFRVLRKPFQHLELLEVIEGAFASVARLQKASTDRMFAETERERRALDGCLGGTALRLARQPIVHIDALEAPLAFEGLLRPFDPHFDNPTQLIQAAERHGKVFELGRRVFELAAELVGQLGPSQRLFVNLHPHQLGDPDRLVMDIEALRPVADRVIFEITERSRLQDIEHWEASIEVLEEGGFATAVDDLGAGYSALSMLADLKPQYIKLDMSLVRALDESPRKRRLIALLVTFGNATGSKVIAEGVETRGELRALRGCGVEFLQGYLVGAPVT